MRPDRAHFRNNHGVITRAEARALGFSASQVDARCASGEWERIGPAVFRLGGAPPTWLGEARAAALSADGLASHRAAARLWQLDGFKRSPLELTVAIGRRRGERVTSRWHRSTQMALADPTVVQGVPCTGLTRTVLDLAGVVRHERLHEIVDEVLRRKLATWGDLYEVLIRHARRGRSGVASLRALLDVRLGETAIPDSRWNRMVWQLLVDAGLPEPRVEFEVHDDAGRLLGRVDLAYPGAHLGIELDSRRYHLNSTSFASDRVRSNQLVNANWRLLHFTWEVFADRPWELVRTVREALATRTLRAQR